MAIFEASSLEQAVEMAVGFKRDGQYDWFRGQTGDLVPTPSMGRLNEEEFAKAKERLCRFFYWIIKTPGLTELKRDPDAVLAIAQHYGIPTHFLDFTTDPGIAGFFAATKGQLRSENRSCIYCLNTTVLRKVWSNVREVLPDYPDIDFVRPRVPNLWRLEAQHGAFLFCPTNWQSVYVMDRIVFPASGLPAYPTMVEVYPERKSQLELLLDHYFGIERFTGFRDTMQTVFPDAKIFELKAPPGGFEADYFVGGRFPIRMDWRRNALSDWLKVAEESFRTTALGEIGLRVSLRAKAQELRQRVAFGVRRVLQSNPSLRMKAVRWLLLPQRRLNSRLAHALDSLWNGVRLLPYTDEEIAEGIGLCFALHSLGFHEAEREEDQLPIIQSCLGPSLRVEFSSWEGSSARAFVSRNELLGAVRPNVQRYLRPRHRTYATQISPLLQLCSNPRRLFIFRKLARLFATQLGPTQVMRIERCASHFSPARLDGFGLP
jgi:hypothetical protein